MTTIVNTPAPNTQTNGGGMGIIITVVILAVVLFIFFVYGLPAIKNIGSPQINIPSTLDVNINQQK